MFRMLNIQHILSCLILLQLNKTFSSESFRVKINYCKIMNLSAYRWLNKRIIFHRAKHSINDLFYFMRNCNIYSYGVP